MLGLVLCTLGKGPEHVHPFQILRLTVHFKQVRQCAVRSTVIYTILYLVQYFEDYRYPGDFNIA